MRMSKIQWGRASRDYGVGRKCAYPGCPHSLSRYNPDDICSSHNRKPMSIEGLKISATAKICSCCGELKPSTTEYFRSRRGRLEAQCRGCTNLKRRERSSRRREVAHKAAVLAEQFKDAPRRKCSTCGELKPNTVEYFRRFDSPNGAQCKVCARKQRARREAAQRKAAAAKGA